MARLRPWLTCFLALSLSLAAGAGPATRSLDKMASMRQWLAGLADGDAEARELARYNLMGLDRSDLPALCKLVEQSRPLEPSQLAALREIVTHVFLRGDPYDTVGDKGFLGVHLMDALIPAQVEDPRSSGAVNAILISGRVEGFCGERSLREGDVVLDVMESPLPRPRNLQAFMSVVVAAKAGQTLHLKVLRLGRMVTVPVTLDARPMEAEGMRDEVEQQMEQMKFRRLREAAAYWQRNFAPLVGEKVS